jgi:hypothetical protein
MVAELVPAPPTVVGCLGEIDAILNDMSADTYAALDPVRRRHHQPALDL